MVCEEVWVEKIAIAKMQDIYLFINRSGLVFCVSHRLPVFELTLFSPLNAHRLV